jgi:hypothetical protein
VSAHSAHDDHGICKLADPPERLLMFGSADTVTPEVSVTPREQAAGHRRPRATRRAAPRRCARRSALRSGQPRIARIGAALPRLDVWITTGTDGQIAGFVGAGTRGLAETEDPDHRRPR